jgi:hypothetical protein
MPSATTTILLPAADELTAGRLLNVVRPASGPVG